MKEIGLNLLFEAEEIANKYYDGHLTVMKFTTGWKVCFGTPDLDSGRGRGQIRELKKFDILPLALLTLIIDHYKKNETNPS